MKTMRAQTVVHAALLVVVGLSFGLLLVFGTAPVASVQELSHLLMDAVAWHLPSIQPDMDQILSAMR